MISKFDDEAAIISNVSNGQKLMEAMEKSQKPVVAAIMGPCLGAGLEV